jgi:hypothetical protein
MQDHPERINVAAHRNFPAGALFGRLVCGRAFTNAVALNLTSHDGQAEIGDQDLSQTVEHHVAGLEVTMEDSFIVCRGETCAKAAGDLDRFVAGESPDAPKQRAEVLAIDVFHGEEDTVA